MGFVVHVLVALGATGCSSDDPDPPPTTVTTTAPVSVTTTPPVSVTLPVDPRPRTPPSPATADFEGLGAWPSFDLLAEEVVAAVERLHPGESDNSEGRLRTESAHGSAGTTGTVLVRRYGFPDDSVAGYEYVVTTQQGPDGWVAASATKATVCHRGVSGSLCT